MPSYIRGSDNFDSQLKTVNGNSLIGSGNIEAGASTDFNAVGTYNIGRPASTTNYGINNTASSVQSVAFSYLDLPRYSGGWVNTGQQSTLSGTWRFMNGARNYGGWGCIGLCVRIS